MCVTLSVCTFLAEVPMEPLCAWLAHKFTIALEKVNLALVKKFLKDDITDMDAESLAHDPQMRLLDVSLAMHDVLFIPPGWIMLEKANSQTVAGLTTCCVAYPKVAVWWACLQEPWPPHEANASQAVTSA